jgi:hypothetical protein
MFLFGGKGKFRLFGEELNNADIIKRMKGFHALLFIHKNCQSYHLIFENNKWKGGMNVKNLLSICLDFDLRIDAGIGPMQIDDSQSRKGCSSNWFMSFPSSPIEMHRISI